MAKSKDEERLEELLDEYLEKFDENYPIVITDQRTFKEIISDIEAHLKSGKPAETPKYKKGADY